MAGENAFEVEGLVTEAFSNGTWQVELKNGHRLRGFVTRKTRAAIEPLRTGDRVQLKLSPCDLSEGRIVGKVIG